MKRQQQIDGKVLRETERIGQESVRILNRLDGLATKGKGWSLLRISDEFAAIARAAERARWRAYELYMWMGREEIKRQRKGAKR